MGDIQWFEIVNIVLSGLSICGFGVIMKNFWDDKHAKKLADTKEQKELVKKQRQDEVREVIKDEVDPLKKDVSDIKSNLSKNTEGTITLLRDKMKDALNRGREKGWASTSDKANWHELYNTYKQLGGNHFSEYVDQWKYEVDSLPSEEEYIAQHPVRSRKSNASSQKSNSKNK